MKHACIHRWWRAEGIDLIKQWKMKDYKHDEMYMVDQDHSSFMSAT